VGVPLSRLRRRIIALWLPVLAVYTAALWFERWGIRSPLHGTDIGVYAQSASEVAHGRIPYRDFYFQYPPGALVPVLAARAFSGYAMAFKIVIAVLGAASLVTAAVCLRACGRRLLWPLLTIAIAPVLVGSVFVNRFDVWPALLTVAALALIAEGRPVLACAFLGAGAVTKVFPAAAAPAAAVWMWRAYGTETLKRALAAFVGTAAAILLPFAALGPGGLRFVFTVQLTRHLQTESLGGAILLAADRLGIYRPTIATGNPGSLDLFGAVPDVIGMVSIAFVVAAIVWGAWLLSRGPVDLDRALTAVVAAIAIYVAFGKVLSPQYVLWLVPIVPLARRRFGVAATLLLSAALVLTQLEFDHHYGQLRNAGPVVWTLLARDLLLVAVAGILVVASCARAQPGVLSRSARSPRT
jgi:uncharacterized membrane protein